MREDQKQTLLSMTAIGSSYFEINGQNYVMELKSLNSKGFDLKCLLPEELSELELPLRQHVSVCVTRGKIELKIRRQKSLSAGTSFDKRGSSLNYEQLEAYLACYQELSEWLKSYQGEHPSIKELLTWPNVLTHAELPLEPQAVRQAVMSALNMALHELLEMRAKEGQALLAILHKHLMHMRTYLSTLSAATEALSTLRSQKLKARLETLLEGHMLDPHDPRLLVEVALLSDKSDVTEELNRLALHLDHFESLLNLKEPVGRRCDFLCQELLREANTVGSKLHEVGVTHILVEFKAEIERLREQIQNIE